MFDGSVFTAVASTSSLAAFDLCYALCMAMWCGIYYLLPSLALPVRHCLLFCSVLLCYASLHLYWFVLVGMFLLCCCCMYLLCSLLLLLLLHSVSWACMCLSCHFWRTLTGVCYKVANLNGCHIFKDFLWHYQHQMQRWAGNTSSRNRWFWKGRGGLALNHF